MPAEHIREILMMDALTEERAKAVEALMIEQLVEDQEQAIEALMSGGPLRTA